MSPILGLLYWRCRVDRVHTLFYTMSPFLGSRLHIFRKSHIGHVLTITLAMSPFQSLRLHIFRKSHIGHVLTITLAMSPFQNLSAPYLAVKRSPWTSAKVSRAYEQESSNYTAVQICLYIIRYIAINIKNYRKTIKYFRFYLVV